MGSEVPVLGTLSDLDLCIFPSGCPPVSFVIPFNKLVIISDSLSSVSSSSKSMEPKERVVGTSDLQPNLTEAVGELGTYYL